MCNLLWQTCIVHHFSGGAHRNKVIELIFENAKLSFMWLDSILKRLKLESTNKGKLLFISHSHEDRVLAERIVELLQVAYLLSTDQIYCSAAPGFGPNAGTDITTRSLYEAEASMLFILLLTPGSLGSAYVWAEVGARIRAKKEFFPLTLDAELPRKVGLLANRLYVPIQEKDALDSFVSSLSAYLPSPERSSTYKRKIDELVNLAQQLALRSGPASARSLFKWESTRDNCCYLFSKRTRKCLTIIDSRHLVQRDCGAEIHQKWRIEKIGDGFFKVISASGDLCLDVQGGGVHDNNRVIVHPFRNTDNQKWKIEIEQDGSFIFVAKHSKKCLDLRGGSRHDDAEIIQFQQHNGDNQCWRAMT